MECLPPSLASIATIEGASGAGKTTLLRGLARHYACDVIEVGMIVRALAWFSRENATSIPDAVAALAALDGADALRMRSSLPDSMAAMNLDIRGLPLGDEVFTSALGDAVAAAALSEDAMAWVHALVRERLRGRRAAVSGRDIASRTVPGSRLVIRLDADPVVRRARKLAQLAAAGLSQQWQDDAPLLPAAVRGTHYFDTSSVSPSELLDLVGALAEKRLGWIPRLGDGDGDAVDGFAGALGVPL